MAEFIKNPKNSYVFGLLVLFATMYGPRLSPKLPEPIQNLFEHTWFRGAIMFLAIYMAQHDLKTSLIVTIVFMVLMNIIQNSNLFETFLQNYERNMEGFVTSTSSNSSCGPTVTLTQDQKSKITDGEIGCINSIKQWFSCEKNSGKPLTAQETKNDSGDNTDDSFTQIMMTNASRIANGNGASGVGEAVADDIKSVCDQAASIPSSNPYKERITEGCRNLTNPTIGKCVPSIWEADNEGKAVTAMQEVPEFYRGPCALVDRDVNNKVFYKPQCFDKEPNGNCGSKSLAQCKSSSDKCFWKTEGGSFSNTEVQPSGSQSSLKVNCIPKQYNEGNSSCGYDASYTVNAAKNSRKANPPCVQDTQFNPGQDVPSMPSNSCNHSGECCGYKGDTPNGTGSHCLRGNGQYGNLCVNLDTTNANKFDDVWSDVSTELRRANIIDDDQMQLEYGDVGKSKWNAMFIPTSKQQPTWSNTQNPHLQKQVSGLDWGNVYYGDDSTKASDPNSPNYPGQLFKGADDKLGMGCWVPTQDVISGDSTYIADVGPNIMNTEKEQQAKKEFRTVNYQSGYGVIHNKNEGFIGSNKVDHANSVHQPNHVSGHNDLGSHAPPVSSCSAYDPKSMKFIGTASYPLNPNNTLLDSEGLLPNKQPAYSGETNFSKSVGNY